MLARQTKDSEQKMRLIEKGDNVLTKMRYWSEHSSWNWESKMTLLDAEKMYTLGSFDQALLFYERAIRSANEHKFVNDEADGFFFLTNDEYESKFEDVNDKGLLDKCGECGVVDFLTEFGFCEDCQEQLESDTIRQYNSSK